MRALIATALCVFVLAPQASASDWQRCDPRREDFFTSFGCEDVRRDRQRALEAELARLQNEYEQLVIEGATLDRRIAAYTQLKSALQKSVRESEQKIASLEAQLNDRRNANRALREILAEMESIDSALTRILSVGGHCLSTAEYAQVEEARREWRRQIETGKDIADIGQAASEGAEYLAEVRKWSRNLRIGARLLGRAFGIFGLILMFVPDEPPERTGTPSSSDPLCVS
jgi:hypothetical protein